MYIGYVVGIIVVIILIICGVAGLVIGVKNKKNYKWALGLIIAGIVALISAAVNYNLFYK